MASSFTRNAVVLGLLSAVGPFAIDMPTDPVRHQKGARHGSVSIADNPCERRPVRISTSRSISEWSSRPISALPITSRVPLWWLNRSRAWRASSLTECNDDLADFANDSK
jgi:hypothetical protein